MTAPTMTAAAAAAAAAGHQRAAAVLVVVLFLTAGHVAAAPPTSCAPTVTSWFAVGAACSALGGQQQCAALASGGPWANAAAHAAVPAPSTITLSSPLPPAGVALRHYAAGEARPRLFFSVASVLLLPAGANVTSCAVPQPPLPTVVVRRLHRRELLAPPPTTTINNDDVVVAAPGDWSFTVSVDGSVPVAGARVVSYSNDTTAAAAANTTTSIIGELVVPVELFGDEAAPSGQHCADVNVAVGNFSVVFAANGSSAASMLPASFSSSDGGGGNDSSMRVCWWSAGGAGQARATVAALDDAPACGDHRFALTVSDIWPAGVPLTRGGVPVTISGGGNGSSDNATTQLWLLRPAVQVWGRLVATLNGTAVDTDEAASGGGGTANAFSFYVLPQLPPAAAGNAMAATVTWQLPKAQAAALPPGFYELSAKVALLSARPGLVDLEGASPVGAQQPLLLAAAAAGGGGGGALTPVDVAAAFGGGGGGGGTTDDSPLPLTEYMATTLVDRRTVGLQREPTTLSQASAERSGDGVVLTWTFAGVSGRGAAAVACFHDDDELPPDSCASPLTLLVRPFVAGVAAHSVRVAFTDVCGGVKEALFEYGSDGSATVLSAIDTPGQTPPPPPLVSLVGKRNSAAAGAGGGGGGRMWGRLALSAAAAAALASGLATAGGVL